MRLPIIAAAVIAVWTFVYASAAQAACFTPDATNGVAQRGIVTAGKARIEFVASKVKGVALDPFGFYETRITAYDAQCHVLYDRLFQGRPDIRFDTVKIAPFPVVAVVAMEPGGSACNYEHVFLDVDGGRSVVSELSITDEDGRMQRTVSSENQGGFYIGDLGKGMGPGLAKWYPANLDGAHYDPHPFAMELYRWNGTRFVFFKTLQTKEALSDWKQTPAKLGFTFRDSTSLSC